MNGSCAGGTGAFIDQMSTLLDTDAAGLNAMAKDYTTLYPIASRCGVFAKTDLQPLINDGAAKPDLAASIFTAVATQTPFVQEVIAETRAIDQDVPQADVIIELGGEDAKITYLKPTPEQRMNGSRSCRR